MRDQYAGDVSDYLKYAFLRALVPAEARLGVAWYFLPGDDGRPDGRHDEYLQDIRWRALDPELFDQLKGREHRTVAAVEKLGFWPARTTFHAEPVPPGQARDTWAAAMRATLSEAQAVFLDPDNGVSREGVISRKSATVAEVNAFFATGRLGLLIRFPHRVATHAIQLEAYHRTFASMEPVTIQTCARVPNKGGGSAPRIRWFTALNASAEVRARMAEFAARVEALPGGSATVASGVMEIKPPNATNDPVLRLTLYWKSADLMRAHADALRSAPGLEAVIEDGEFWRYHTYLTAWLGALYVVAEGFTKLELADDAVEALIMEHGDSLRRFRNSIYHFEMNPERQLQFLRGPPSRLNGALELHEALRVFLLRYAGTV